MRCKAPQNVLLGANFSDVQSVRVQIINLSERTRLNQFLQGQHCRVVAQDMSDHQDSTLRGRDVHQFRSLTFLNRQRLFHIHVFARQQGGLSHLKVRHRRRGQRHGVNVRPCQHAAELSIIADTLIVLFNCLGNRRRRIADALQCAQFMKHSDQILSPIPHARDGYSWSLH